jgi:hypothetical protein
MAAVEGKSRLQRISRYNACGNEMSVLRVHESRLTYHPLVVVPLVEVDGGVVGTAKTAIDIVITSAASEHQVFDIETIDGRAAGSRARPPSQPEEGQGFI